jgi:chemotaxis protein MotA
MLLVIGYLIVIGSTLGGFMIAGGNPMVLMHVSEFVVIGGVALGLLVVASPASVLKSLLVDLKNSFTSSGASKDDFIDLFKLLYELFITGRRNGLIALDEHVGDPESSAIFTKYPSFTNDPERREFLCSALRPIIDGKIKPDQLEEILESEIESREEEAKGPMDILNLVGDSLPGVGIIAAVLGIINTMAAISEGPEKVGQKVAAALTGTFLGILGAYGFVNPLHKRIGFSKKAHFAYFTAMSKAVAGFAKGLSPIMAIEISRRSLEASMQPEADELENLLKAAVSKK